MVYYYTKRVMLARLLANKGLAIYVVHLNRYFVIPPWYYLVVTFCDSLNALCYRVLSRLFLHSSCCAFCEFTTCTAFSFSSLLLGQSLHWCPIPSYLKHLIPFSCAFLLMEHTSSFFGGISYGIATHTTLFLLSFLFLGHSFYRYPSSLYLKHCIASFSFLFPSCLLISTSHLITLLDNTSNIFWETDALFPFSFLFLQLQVRCPNFLHL